MTPPLNGIRAFEAVARHRSFTRAATELNVTQSAISHQVRKLEQYLGVALFHRVGNELTVTAEGMNLYPDVHEAFTLIRRSVNTLRQDLAGRPFGLWLRSHFALKWLAPRLVDFWARHPGFDLRLMHSNEPADFTNASIDMAIEWRHIDEPRNNTRLLVEGMMTPACSPALLERGPPITGPEDLRHQALLHEADTVTWQQWLDLAGVPDLKPAANHYFDDTNVRHQAVVEGQGFALVCPSLVRDDLEAGRMACPLDINLETHNYMIVYPPSGQPSLASRKFTTWLLSQVEQIKDPVSAPD